MSFPRRRESIELAGTEWIPAFAGMTLFSHFQAELQDQRQLRKTLMILQTYCWDKTLGSVVGWLLIPDRGKAGSAVRRRREAFVSARPHQARKGD